MSVFAFLTFLVAFAIEGLGTLVSVIGLSALFGSNPIIIAFAIALDAGKLIVVSLLYKYWKHLNVMMRGYALAASIITMVITSAGAAGYLSGEFQKAMTGTQEISLKTDALKSEYARLEERKKQIDRQIESIPEKYTARQRIVLMNQFKDEQKVVTARLTQIDKELPETQTKQISVEAKAGPILAIAKSFNISPEEAVKWVILVIILVFDPLAVFLIIAGNFLYDKHRQEKIESAGRVRESPVIDKPLQQEATTLPPQQDPIVEPPLQSAPVQEFQSPAAWAPAPAPQITLRTDVQPVEDLVDVPSLILQEKQLPVVEQPVADVIAEEAQDTTPIEQSIEEYPDNQLPVIDENENVRQVITFADLKTRPAARSSLEDIDAAHGDVGMDQEPLGSQPPKRIQNLYVSESPIIPHAQ